MRLSPERERLLRPRSPRPPFPLPRGAAATLHRLAAGLPCRSEMMAAKSELRERMRDDFTSAVGKNADINSLLNYSKQVVEKYDTMSQEERDASGWKSSTRQSAQSYVDLISGTSTRQSLFDLLGSND